MPESPSVFRSAFAMLLLFVLLTMTTCTALAQPTTSARTLGIWATAGAGTMTSQGQSAPGDGIGVHIQRGALVASARRHTVAWDRGTSLEEIALVVGRATQSQGPLAAALSAGVARVQERGYFDREPGVSRGTFGGSIVGDVSLRRGGSSGLGVGLTAFANVNSRRSFGGVEVELLAGRWR